jgi:hypothetical protein
LNLGEPVGHRPLDDHRHAFQRLLVGHAGRLGQLVEQRLLLGFGGGVFATFLSAQR